MRPRVAPVAWLAVLILASAHSASGAGLPATERNLELHYVGVGQGDAALIISPTGTVVAIDAGPAGSACDDLIAYYASVGVTGIDYFITSNYDAGSIGCVPNLLERFPVRGQVLDRGGRNRTPTFKAYKAAVGRDRKRAKPGRTLTLDSDRSESTTARIEIVAVNGRAKGGRVRVPASNQNDRGVVVVLRMGSFDATFGGDIGGFNEGGAKDIETLVASIVGRIEVYKIHDNGSPLSTSQGWLETVRPRVAVLSVGRNDPLGYPAKSVMDRLHDAGVQTYWTSRGSGARPVRRFDTVAGTVIIEVEPGTSEFAVRYGDRADEFNNHDDVRAPGVPVDLTANVTGDIYGSTITARWKAPESGGAPESYVLEVGTFAGASDYGTFETTGTSLRITNVSTGTYYLRVRAVNGAGTSAASPDTTATVE